MNRAVLEGRCCKPNIICIERYSTIWGGGGGGDLEPKPGIRRHAARL
jgi:hypothetical protein